MATGVNSSLQEESDQTDRQIDREEDINEEKEWGARGKRVFARWRLGLGPHINTYFKKPEKKYLIPEMPLVFLEMPQMPLSWTTELTTSWQDTTQLDKSILTMSRLTSKW